MSSKQAAAPAVAEKPRPGGRRAPRTGRLAERNGDRPRGGAADLGSDEERPDDAGPVDAAERRSAWAMLARPAPVLLVVPEGNAPE